MAPITLGTHLSTIQKLANEIAQVAPEVTERALKIVALAHELRVPLNPAVALDEFEEWLREIELSDPMLD